jgi:putative nucleotidyltransferase with HDIG domain
MRIHVTELHIGDQLTSNIFNNYGLHVLTSATILTGDDISKLFRHNIDYVDITMRNNFETNVVINPHYESIIANILPKFETATLGIKSLFDQVRAEGKIDERIVHQNTDPLLEQFQKEKDVVSLLLTLTNKDDYTYQHCVQVGMISYYLALWTGLTEEQALLTGKAGFLHDIGKSKIDEIILNKPGRLTDEEFQLMKNHTTFGYEIINNSLSTNKEISLVALQHHERLNGTGYPNKLTREQVHPMSKIISVADVYSAMISSRVYQKKRDLLFVLRELYKLSFSELDPRIVQSFIRKMIPNFIGKNLVMTSGEVGQIIMTNPTDVFRPLVKINDQFMDMSKNHQYEIDTIFI